MCINTHVYMCIGACVQAYKIYTYKNTPRPKLCNCAGDGALAQVA